VAARLHIVAEEPRPGRGFTGKEVGVFVHHQDGTVVPLEGVQTLLVEWPGRDSQVRATIVVQGVSLDVVLSAENVLKVVEHP
jgi:hypothetical protein